MDKNNPVNLKNRNSVFLLLIIVSLIFSISLMLVYADNTSAITSSQKILCEGSQFETTAYFFLSEQNGPIVMIMAGVHGDEFAGIEATKQFIKRINDTGLKKGTVIIIPEANKEAVNNSVRAMSPLEDLNRNFPGEPASEGIKGLAGEIFDIIIKNEVDFLLDLHESVDYFQEGATFYGQTIVLDDHDILLKEVADYLLQELNSAIIYPENQFQIIQKPIEGSSTYESLDKTGTPGITFETCTKIEYGRRVEFHLICIEKLLDYFDMILP